MSAKIALPEDSLTNDKTIHVFCGMGVALEDVMDAKRDPALLWKCTVAVPFDISVKRMESKLIGLPRSKRVMLVGAEVGLGI